MPEHDKYAISVKVRTEYLATHSDPDNDRYVFAYEVTLTNTGAITAQLRDRHWIITDGAGHSQEIRGEGVVGEQPSLAPGQGYRYTSGCSLSTPVGTMHGHYGMQAENGHLFLARIAPFTLAMPHALN